jgi:hypothetical protein
MLVSNPIFTGLAEIEILTHRALVSNTEDRRGSATVTSYPLVLLQLKFLVNSGGITLSIKILAFSELLENLRSMLLQLLLNQFLNGIARW